MFFIKKKKKKERKKMEKKEEEKEKKKEGVGWDHCIKSETEYNNLTKLFFIYDPFPKYKNSQSNSKS